MALLHRGSAGELDIDHASAKRNNKAEHPLTDLRGLFCRDGDPDGLRSSRSRSHARSRPPNKALPLKREQFWGVQVYRVPLTDVMVRRSLEKYEAFYRFAGSCIRVLLERFGSCVVYDIHSYNISRQVEKGINNPPLFNLGTALLDRSHWGSRIDSWLHQLSRIEVPGIGTTVEENRVFSGVGELCRRLMGWDPRILVLPTEIAKVYMDERTGILHDTLIDALGRELRKAIAAQTPPTDRY